MKEKVYEFKDQGKSCVIYEPKPPRHWFNYLWSEKGYVAQISQSGHGRSYYLNEKAEMCMVNNQDARYVYFRNDDTGECWNIGAMPMGCENWEYRCDHSIAYTRLSSIHEDIKASWQMFVPWNGYHEIWKLSLENLSDKQKRISLFEAVTFELEGFSYPRYYENYRCMQTEFDEHINGIYCSSNHPFAPHKRYNAYLVSSEPVYAYDGDLTCFCGSASTITKLDASAYALFQRPEVVVSGKDCTNSDAALFILGGVLQHKILLDPGQRHTVRVAFGISESRREAAVTAKLLKNEEEVQKIFYETQEHYRKKYDGLSVQTPDEKINCIMNQWVKKQVDCCIVGKKGVRDNLQIAVAMLNFRQDKAKEEILECLRHQFRDGHGVLTWYPYDDTRYSDQPFWIIWAVCELLKETGDLTILEQNIGWQDGGEASVMEHLKAAVDCLLRDKGRNGLIRIYFADWNDALNITTDPEAESVMLSEQFCLALKEMAGLMRQTGDEQYALFLEKEYLILKQAINDRAWDGQWYMRALSNVENIGSKDSAGSKIYLNAQTWAVLADVAEGERLTKVVKAIDGMEQDFGFPLNMPPYETYSPNVGRMSAMLPGLFENGGVYCHATAFKIFMDCKLGRGTKAVETMKKIMPDSEKNPCMQSGAEPYVFTNCYSTHPKYYGKSYWSWTTGTSAWALRALYEGIMGLKRDYDGLKIEPCLPDDWEYAEVNRIFRGDTYHIVYENPCNDTSKNPQIMVDGTELVGTMLPVYGDGRLHEVKVNWN